MKNRYAIPLCLIICIGLTIITGCDLFPFLEEGAQDPGLLGEEEISGAETLSATDVESLLNEYAELVTSLPSLTPSPTKTLTPTPTTTSIKTPTPTATSIPPTKSKTPLPPATSTPAGCQVTYNSSFEDEVISLINQARANNGIDPLTKDVSMSTLAREHSTWMACNNEFSHSEYFSGEIIAAGQMSPSEVVSYWMASEEGHNEILLDPYYTVIGVGYAYVPGSTYTRYWTAGFDP